MSSIVEEAVRRLLAPGPPESAPPRLEFPTFGTGGTLPGVDITNNASLQDIMDGVE